MLLDATSKGSARASQVLPYAAAPTSAAAAYTVSQTCSAPRYVALALTSTYQARASSPRTAGRQPHDSG